MSDKYRVRAFQHRWGHNETTHSKYFPDFDAAVKYFREIIGDNEKGNIVKLVGDSHASITSPISDFWMEIDIL